MLAAATAIVSALGVGVTDAAAQNFFDRLFGGPVRERRYVDDRRYVDEMPVERSARPPSEAPKVDAPKYLTYKADALVRVDFRSLVAAVGQGTDVTTTQAVVAAAQPGAAPVATDATTAPAVAPVDPFRAAIAGLDAFDLRTEKDIAEALLAHYKADPSFIWVSDGKPNMRAELAAKVLADAAAEALDPADYRVTLPDQQVMTDDQRQPALVRYEMEMSARVLRYVRDATRGRIDPNRISEYHDFKLKPVDYTAALDVLHDAIQVDVYLRGFHPKDRHYAALKAELAKLRASQENTIVVDAKLFLRPGGSSAELPKLMKLIEQNADAAFMAKHGAAIAASAGSETYSDDLVAVVRDAQAARGLKNDGVIGPRTVAAIAGNSRADRLTSVKVAMEQFRWLPSELPARHVFINVPEYKATYVEGGAEKLSMRTVVGKTATQTFFFQDEIEYVEFHPYWGIPRSILVNKYLPKLYENPGYLDQIGYEITDAKGRQISSSSVNWYQYGTKIPFDVRQPPGPKNSLGEMKIMFPNEHAIYMHDTPEKELFGRENRAQSNGCIRLQDPRAMAAAVLGWSRGQIEDQLKGKNQQVNLPAKVPVYVTYFTAWPAADGAIVYSPDVYSRDGYIQKAFESTETARRPAV